MITVDRAVELDVPAAVAKAGVRVWLLDLHPGADDAASALLAADDIGRAAAMAPEVAGRFLARRALVGRVAAEVLPGGPVRWGDEGGRPFVEAAGHRLQASLSSSGDVALLALAPGVVGVDVERATTPVPDAEEVAGTFFTPEEAAWVGGDRDRFLAVWVRKEAVVKATGEGMSRLLDTFVVDPVAAAAPVHHADGRPFGLQTVSIDVPGLVAAVAVPV